MKTINNSCGGQGCEIRILTLPTIQTTIKIK